MPDLETRQPWLNDWIAEWVLRVFIVASACMWVFAAGMVVGVLESL